jgi:hypothetical protein
LDLNQTLLNGMSAHCFVLLGALEGFVPSATNLAVTPSGVWLFCDGHAAIEFHIHRLRDEFALRRIPTASLDANALYAGRDPFGTQQVRVFEPTCPQSPGKA